MFIVQIAIFYDLKNTLQVYCSWCMYVAAQVSCCVFHCCSAV